MNTERNVDRDSEWTWGGEGKPPVEWDRERVWSRIREAVPAESKPAKWPFLRLAAAVLLLLLIGFAVPEWQEDEKSDRPVAARQEMPEAAPRVHSPESVPATPPKTEPKLAVQSRISADPQARFAHGPAIVPPADSQYITVELPRDPVYVEALAAPTARALVVNSITAELPYDLSAPTPTDRAKIVLRIPVSGDKREAGKPFLTRLLQQMKNFNTAGEIDWQEFNIRAEDPLSFSIYRLQRDSSVSSVDLDD